MKKSNKGFTLVELIVTITILSILGTITFINLQGYSAQSRDAKRVSDIANIRKSLELFTINTGKYPLPDNGFEVLYDGELARIQGTVGDNVTTNLSRNLNKKPLDPLTELEYTYSVINSQVQYEVLTIYESDLISYNNLIEQINASNSNYPKISGNYNQVFLKTPHYYVPTPTIINAEFNLLGGTGTLDNDNIKSQIITGGPNNIANGTNLSLTGGLDGLTLEAFSGTISRQNDDNKVELVQSLIDAYSGSILENNGIYKTIVETTGTGDLISLIDDLVLSSGTYVSSFSSGDGGDGEETPIVTGKSVIDCIESGDVVYGTEDGTDIDLTCEDDIIVCSGTGTGYTIQACNVGATTVYINQTFPSETSLRTSAINEWAGGLYQWGNNADNSMASKSTSQVNTSSYGPGNYYDNAVFIKGNPDWSSVLNNNLWGNTTDTDEARQGPCVEGYHVPTQLELQTLVNLKWDMDDSNQGTLMSIELKLPYAGDISRSDASIYRQDNRGVYWASSPSYNVTFYSNSIVINNNSRASGYSVRCFKN